MNRAQTALIITASAVVTLTALVPLNRTMSKIDPQTLRVLHGVFWRQSFLPLLVGATAVLLGAEFRGKSPLIGWGIILLSPLLVLIANFLLLLLVLPQG